MPTIAEEVFNFAVYTMMGIVAVGGTYMAFAVFA